MEYKMRIGFMGRSRFLLDTIKLLSKNQNHKICFIWTSKSEDYYDCPEEEYKDLANILNCDYYFSAKIEEIEPRINFDKVDVVISMNFVNLIPKEFLDKVKFGILNAHAGDLPKYKGNAVTNWAIINDEDKIVLTIHEMLPELDSGPIYEQEDFLLEKSKDISHVYEWLGQTIPNLFNKAINEINEGNKPIPQRKTKPLRVFPRKPEDSRIIWSEGARKIHNLIRASSHPFEGAYCYLNNDKSRLVRIFRCEEIDLPYDFFAIDGQILEYGKEFFIVSSNNQAIKIYDFHLNNLNKKDSLKEIVKSMRNRLT